MKKENKSIWQRWCWKRTRDIVFESPFHKPQGDRISAVCSLVGCAACSATTKQVSPVCLQPQGRLVGLRTWLLSTWKNFYLY